MTPRPLFCHPRTSPFVFFEEMDTSEPGSAAEDEEEKVPELRPRTRSNPEGAEDRAPSGQAGVGNRSEGEGEAASAGHSPQASSGHPGPAWAGPTAAPAEVTVKTPRVNCPEKVVRNWEVLGQTLGGSGKVFGDTGRGIGGTEKGLGGECRRLGGTGKGWRGVGGKGGNWEGSEGNWDRLWGEWERNRGELGRLRGDWEGLGGH